MKLWLISPNSGWQYVVSAQNYRQLVEKMTQWFGPVQLNTGSEPFAYQNYLIDGTVMGTYRRMSEDELENILENGVQLVYAEESVSL